ncbi:hypothetical protein EZV62_002521 [Acer yangbiense]|uniref:DUF4283 domain-containing protein n=1 Tax=Acer yangbiense TaxID=1000413 RepID=A0A5C7IZA1_9ROSI|nr:hypothetical protein EZV62_002521 [Acer yangbiense]
MSALMATEEIAKLWDAHGEGVESVSHCLVGKVLSRKKINIEAFRNTIGQIWGTMGLLEIEVIADNLFVFHFQSLADREMVCARGPWHFDRCLIVLVKPQGLGEISKLSFNFVEFWVQVHNIPIICMTGKIARLIFNSIGPVIDFPMETKNYWGKFLRAKIRVDISKPLKRGVVIGLEENGVQITAALKYERLSDFCYVYGLIGHTIRECMDDEGCQKLMSGSEPKYGAWLRASPMDKVKPPTNEDGGNRFRRNASKGFEKRDQSYSRNMPQRNINDSPFNQERLTIENNLSTANPLIGQDVSKTVVDDQGKVLEQNQVGTSSEFNNIGYKDGDKSEKVDERDGVSATMAMNLDSQHMQQGMDKSSAVDQFACTKDLDSPKGTGRKWKRVSWSVLVKQSGSMSGTQEFVCNLNCDGLDGKRKNVTEFDAVFEEKKQKCEITTLERSVEPASQARREP